MPEMTDSVTVHIDATPEEVWDLVSDVTKIGRYSPETFEAEWTDGSTGPEVGATFRGHVKRNEKGPVYWAPCFVTESEPNRVFEFGVGKPGGRALNTWRYEIAPGADGGSDVTESFRLDDNIGTKVYWTLLGWARGKTNRNGMRRTLEAMKAELEGGSTPA
jgi:uncharacterized protein YndB with AHSA1/START domain